MLPASALRPDTEPRAGCRGVPRTAGHRVWLARVECGGPRCTDPRPAGKQHADAREGVARQTRAVEPHGVCAVVDPWAGSGEAAPPQEYGTPICEPARRITYSMACGPFTRLTCPVLAPAVLPETPRPARNFRPRSTAVWAATLLACSDAVASASGSPGAPALMDFGSVGSHWFPSALAAADLRCPAVARQAQGPVRVEKYRSRRFLHRLRGRLRSSSVRRCDRKSLEPQW